MWERRKIGHGNFIRSLISFFTAVWKWWHRTVNSAYHDSCLSVLPNTLRAERRYQEVIESEYKVRTWKSSCICKLKYNLEYLLKYHMCVRAFYLNHNEKWKDFEFLGLIFSSHRKGIYELWNELVLYLQENFWFLIFNYCEQINR